MALLNISSFGEQNSKQVNKDPVLSPPSASGEDYEGDECLMLSHKTQELSLIS